MAIDPARIRMKQAGNDLSITSTSSIDEF